MIYVSCDIFSICFSSLNFYIITNKKLFVKNKSAIIAKSISSNYFILIKQYFLFYLLYHLYLPLAHQSYLP